MNTSGFPGLHESIDDVRFVKGPAPLVIPFRTTVTSSADRCGRYEDMVSKTSATSMIRTPMNIYSPLRLEG
jgi:hypothetical protein